MAPKASDSSLGIGCLSHSPRVLAPWVLAVASGFAALSAGCGGDDASSARETNAEPNGDGGDENEGQGGSRPGGGPGGGGDEAAPSPVEPEAAPQSEDDDSPAPATDLETITLDDFPHEIDVYGVADAERAIVMLHGGGGTNEDCAASLGLHSNSGEPKADSVDWDWLEEHRVVAFFPQGQSIDGSPNAFTWSNHVMDSGQDDVAFLEALAKYARETYGVSNVYLAGHSNGGMMANRMWCESPKTFDAYVAFAGPASNDYADSIPCEPDVFQPYFGIVGENDPVLGVPGNWDSPTWEITDVLVALSADAFINPTLIGEWTRQQWRSETVCGDELSAEDAESDGNGDVWSSCDGRLRLQRVGRAEHALETLEAGARGRMLDVAIDFIDSL